MLGVCTSLGLIAVSVLLNFRMGYRSADTELDGWIYGLGAGLGDALKAISPFMAAYGLKHRDWLVGGAAILLFAVFTSYSFIAALGFAAEHRTHRGAELTAAIESRHDTRNELNRAERALTALGNQRPSAEIQADLTARLRKPVGPRGRSVDEISKRCTLNRLVTREDCAAVLGLDSELARAREGERFAETATQLRTVLRESGGQGARTAADAQVEAVGTFAALFRVRPPNDRIQFLLSVLLALIIELGSGLGLFVVSTPWRDGQEPGEGAPTRTTAIETFVLDRLEPKQGADVRARDIYLAYGQWCAGQGSVPLGRKDFDEQFAAIAAAAGVRSRFRNKTVEYLSVALTADIRRDGH